MFTSDQQLRLAQLRQKAISGEKLTMEESREALSILRQSRAAVSVAKPKTRGTKAAAPKPDADQLLMELGDFDVKL